MLSSRSLVLLSFIHYCSGSIGIFRLYARFNDDPDLSRSFLIDLNTSESFVLKATPFEAKYGKDKVFDPRKSITFKDLAIPFSEVYSDYGNESSALASGRVAEDQIEMFSVKFPALFGVVNFVQGSPTEFYGQKFAGRIGFSRKEHKTNLRDKLLRGTPLQVICLEVNVPQAGGLVYAVIVLGRYHYDEYNFYTKIKALPNVNGDWAIRLEKISIGNSTLKLSASSVISSTYDGIGVPSRYFNSVIRMFDAKFDPKNNRFIVDCAQNVPIKISVNGIDIPIQFDAFTKRIQGNECVLNIRNVGQPQFILGLPFFTNNGICLNFDGDEIHFYKARGPTVNLEAGNFVEEDGSVRIVTVQ